MSEQGKRWLIQIKSLNFTKKKLAKWLPSSEPTLRRWEKEGPRYNPAQQEKLVKHGINPSFPAGNGDVVLPGYSILQVVQKIHKN